MAKFHITITDNETGEILADCDTVCIIGAFDRGDDINTGTMYMCKCNGVERATTTIGAMVAVGTSLNKMKAKIRRVCKRIAKAEIKEFDN